MNRLVLPYPVSCNVYYRRAGFRMIKSDEAREYQAKIREKALEAGFTEPLSGAIHVEMSYHPKKPKKWIPGTPTRAQDISNVIKVAEDALNGIAWMDDSQITHLAISKAEPVENGALVIMWRNA